MASWVTRRLTAADHTEVPQGTMVPHKSAPIPIVSKIAHSDSEPDSSRRVASPISMRGYDAASLPADADLHALSDHHSDAMHEMWHADEAGADRAARTASGLADLPLRPVRFRREFSQAGLIRRKPDPSASGRGNLTRDYFRVARQTFERSRDVKPRRRRRSAKQSGTPQPRQAGLSVAEIDPPKASSVPPRRHFKDGFSSRLARPVARRSEADPYRQPR